MTRSKRIVCLANARKLHGRCIAGRELNGERAGAWVRPVSARQAREVSEYERQYEDGSDPQVLDVIDVPVLKHLPTSFQTENWLLDGEWYWRKAGRYSWFDLDALASDVAPLWLDGDSTYNGMNDRVAVAAAGALNDSLRLIHVEHLDLRVFAPGEAFGNRKRRVQGRFHYAGMPYALWVTDPRYERAYLAKLNGNYAIDDCFLTISLGEEHEQACHKLIFAIIECGRSPSISRP